MSAESIQTFVYLPLISIAVSTAAYTVICLIMPRGKLLSASGYVHALRLLFLMYAAYLLMLTLRPAGNTDKHVNPLPFRTITASLSGTKAEKLNLLLNIVAFIPFGALYPAAFNRNAGLFTVMFMGFAATCAIELAQAALPYFRMFDVDDIILNMLGCVLGYAVYALIRKNCMSRRNKFLDKTCN